MTKTNNPDEIVDALAKVGFERDYISSILPSWWNYDVLDNAAGLTEFKLLLSRNLGVDYKSLSEPSPRIEFKLPHNRKLKRAERYDDVQLSPAMALAFSAARVIAQTCPTKYRELPNAKNIRKHILKKFKANFVSLKSLLVYAWHCGIPVLHIKNLPRKIPFMDGMLVVIDNQPVIVLAHKTRYKAWMAFILAHELGHLALGHCKSGELLVDENLHENSFSEINNDKEEMEANSFALELLSGDESVESSFKVDMKPVDLARTAIKIQKQRQIDAGHTLLKYAYRTGDWQKAIASIQVIESEESASNFIDQAMNEYMDKSSIGSSSLEFLMNISRAKK